MWPADSTKLATASQNLQKHSRGSIGSDSHSCSAASHGDTHLTTVLLQCVSSKLTLSWKPSNEGPSHQSILYILLGSHSHRLPKCRLFQSRERKLKNLINSLSNTVLYGVYFSEWVFVAVVHFSTGYTKCNTTISLNTRSSTSQQIQTSEFRLDHCNRPCIRSSPFVN